MSRSIQTSSVGAACSTDTQNINALISICGVMAERELVEREMEDMGMEKVMEDMETVERETGVAERMDGGMDHPGCHTEEERTVPKEKGNGEETEDEKGRERAEEVKEDVKERGCTGWKARSMGHFLTATVTTTDGTEADTTTIGTTGMAASDKH